MRTLGRLLVPGGGSGERGVGLVRTPGGGTGGLSDGVGLVPTPGGGAGGLSDEVRPCTDAERERWPRDPEGRERGGE